jgi:UDP-N-acetylmuramoyl-tripeptide--D-alanyl-D-alanine ligase
LRFAHLRTPLGRAELRRRLIFLTWAAMARVASLWRRTVARRVRVVAVVGSYGKTTTARATAAVLGADEKHRHPAHAVLMLRPGVRRAVLEVGIDRPGQMAERARAVQPQVVVVTSIGSEHRRRLRTLEGTRDEKANMVRALPASGLAVLNGDDVHVRWMATQTRARVVTFGFDGANDVRVTEVEVDWPHGLRFVLHVRGEQRRASVRLHGRHQLYPVLAAVAVGLDEGVGLDDALAVLAALPPGSNRLEPVGLAGGAHLLCDHCKSSLETVDAALDTLASIPAGRRVVVLGDLEEPPADTLPQIEATYERLGRRVAEVADRVVFVNVDPGQPRPRYTGGALAGGLAPAAITEVVTPGQAVAALRDDLHAGDVVLLEGAGQQHFDRIRLGLTGRAVACDVQVCTAWMRCGDCPMLERGWDTAEGMPVRSRW